MWATIEQNEVEDSGKADINNLVANNMGQIIQNIDSFVGEYVEEIKREKDAELPDYKISMK